MIHFRNYSGGRPFFSVKIKDMYLQGKRNFIIGRNGAGKTTLFQSIAGIIESEGDLILDSQNVTQLPPEERRIALIPQDLLLFPTMTVEHNLRISVDYGKGDKEIYSRIVSEMGLKDLLKKRGNEVSQGEAQRVAVSRAIISKPRLLLMDEAFSFQDNVARLGMISIVEDLSREYDFDYIYATHDSNDLENGFSNLIGIDGGKIIENVTSLNEVEHFRTLSLLKFRNLVQLNNRYYKITEEAINFSSISGLKYDLVGKDSSSYLRIKIDGRYYFIHVDKERSGQYVNIDESLLEEIPF